MSTSFHRPLIPTRTSIPSQRAQIVARPRLSEKLEGGLGRPLTVVAAPAGFGKTTLVANALRERERDFRVAWLSLDDEDSHPVRFFYHLVAALQSVAPEVGRAPIFLIGSLQLPSSKDLIALLLGEIPDASGRIVLVIDDFHLITNPEIHDAFAFLVERMPEQLRLVIATRDEPNLPLARWRSQQRVSEIGLEDLRFSVDEATMFLEHAIGPGIEPRLVRALEKRTEGWIAGLQMAALALKSPGHGEAVNDIAQKAAAFTGEHRSVIDYLAAEVLRRQPPEIHDFLRKTAVLDRLSAPLCDAVTGGTDSKAILTRLEQANMFLLRLDDRRQWYRFHRLFSDFLRSDLDAATQRQSHLKASAWFEEHGFGEEAIRHAFAGGDVAATVRLFRAFADDVLSRGELSKLRAWLDELPDPLVRTHSDLACYRAWVLYLHGKTAQAEPYARLARELDVSDATPTRRGMLSTIHAYIALNWGDPREAVAPARRALDQLGNGTSFFRIYALSMLGQAQALTGDRESAIDTLRDAVQLGQEIGNHLMTVDATGPLAEMMIAKGQLREAMVLCRNGLEHFVDAKGTVEPVAGLLYIQLGIIDLELDELDSARYRLMTGIDLSRQLGVVFYTLLGLRALARLQHVRGEREAAWNTLAEAREIAQRPESPRRRRLVGLVVAELQLREGNVQSAARTLEEVRPLTGAGSEHEMLVGARLLLAQNQPMRAADLLDRLERAAEREHFFGSLVAIHILQAMCQRALNDEAAAVRHVEHAVSLAASEGYRRVFLDEGRALTGLLSRARHVAPAFVKDLLERFSPEEDTLPIAPLPEALSKMEREILGLVNLGLTNQEVGDRLGITVSTTKWYLTQIFGKLQVRNRTGAIARARQIGLL